jgi:uncharacterized protein YecT (DUF1311 family)
MRIILHSLAVLSMSGISTASEQVMSLDSYKSAVCREPIDSLRAYCREQIDSLDGKLNGAFKEAIRLTPDKTSLRKQQVQWLKEVRDRTSGLPFAEPAIVARVLELQEMSIRAIGRRETMMTGSEQREICESIAREASTGALSNRLLHPGQLSRASPGFENLDVADEFTSGYVREAFSLAVRQGQLFPFANMGSSGTCSSFEIAPAARPLVRPSESWPSAAIDPGLQDDVIRWATWGGGESVLMIRGRYFFVTTNSPDHQPGVVTWVTPVGTRRPICALEAKKVERSVRFVRKDAALCSAAARNELRPTNWEGHSFRDDATEQERQAFRDLQGHGLPSVEQSTIDIDNDGAAELVGRARYDSGAGCGSTSSHLLLLKGKGDGLKSSPVNDSLMQLTTYNSEPVEVLSFRSHQFVAASLERSPALFRVTSTEVQTECIFHDQPISQIKTLFPLDGVVRDPANPSNQ